MKTLTQVLGAQGKGGTALVPYYIRFTIYSSIISKLVTKTLYCYSRKIEYYILVQLLQRKSF